ncbi:beta-N-acetylhexosaminidase [Sediminispirochaeta bajacaliforniensis]|uniref:beta-N-acetylhexosaminidase n=1 Tax=Sediminispirochaeta bajacaliforniensis TaxID=148 RepID=UPI00037816CD|nr:beta-N-acetylhexosaminidase [Sediminispirochaeta bajacaliforniensis]
MKHSLSLIPQVNGNIADEKTRFALSSDSLIQIEPGFEFAAEDLLRFLERRYDLRLTISSHTALPIFEHTQAGIINFCHDSGMFHPEGYQITIANGICDITAQTATGALYAVQTIKQLFHSAVPELPAVKVYDEPLYRWRGFMLDSARHFCSVSEIERILDMMLYLKMNKFHWHLTDDQGWRIEINDYPLLSQVGGLSAPSPGFYTTEELHYVVSYAEERGITVIPEVDLPGHCLSLLAAYPELGCSGGPYVIPSEPGIFYELLCLGNDDALSFSKRLIDYICEIFPGPWIHIGGDEIPTRRWKECPKCQKRIKEEHLSNSRELHTWFANRIQEYAAAKGKNLITWNDGIDEKLSRDIICQFWFPYHNAYEKAVAESKRGRKFIMSDYFSTYLDLSQAVVPLKATYAYTGQLHAGKEAAQEHAILGIEAPLWSEHISDRRSRDKQLFPRILAVAESCWTDAEAKNLHNFIKRVDHLKGFFQTEFSIDGNMYRRDPFVLIRFLKKAIRIISMLRQAVSPNREK